MSRSVLISIQPKWCRLIASGRKTIEVRKSRPKLETPFKAYIYCTKGKQRLLEVMRDGDDCYGETYHGKPVFIKTLGDSSCFMNGYVMNSRVIGYFTVDFIGKIMLDENYGKNSNEQLDDCCLSEKKLKKYLGDNIGYGWHISDLVIYDKPKELSEFGKSRPPQSWCYVEEK